MGTCLTLIPSPPPWQNDPAGHVPQSSTDFAPIFPNVPAGQGDVLYPVAPCCATTGKRKGVK